MNYHLAEACQNTFILIDCLESTPEDVLDWAHQALLKENRDDALILVDGVAIGERLELRMLVLGADKELGEFCGNGARAVAAYLYKHYPHFKEFALKTPWGVHALKHHEGDIYSVELPFPRFERNPKFITGSDFHYVEILEPHLVIEAEMSDVELMYLGRELNSQKELFPLGINVNACHFEENQLFVKTYERGVQRLTRSCGTGSISCAAFFKGRGDVEIVTPGGMLKIAFKKNGINLLGEAKLV